MQEKIRKMQRIVTVFLFIFLLFYLFPQSTIHVEHSKNLTYDSVSTTFVNINENVDLDMSFDEDDTAETSPKNVESLLIKKDDISKNSKKELKHIYNFP